MWYLLFTFLVGVLASTLFYMGLSGKHLMFSWLPIASKWVII